MLDLGAMKHEITSKGCLRLLIKLTGTFSSFQATNKSKHEEVARDTPCRTERASTQSAPTSCKRMVVQQPTALISYYTFLLLLFFFLIHFLSYWIWCDLTKRWFYSLLHASWISVAVTDLPHRLGRCHSCVLSGQVHVCPDCLGRCWCVVPIAYCFEKIYTQKSVHAQKILFVL